MGLSIALNEVTLSFPQVFEPRAVVSGSDPKFSATFILDKERNADDIQRLKEAIKEVIANEHKGNKIPATRIALKDADKDEKYTSKDDYDLLYKGKYVIGCYRRIDDGQPYICDRSNQQIIDPSQIYGGNIVNARIDVYPYFNPSKGVTAGLEGIQLLDPGVRIGGTRTPRDKMFADVSGDEASFDWE